MIDLIPINFAKQMPPALINDPFLKEKLKGIVIYFDIPIFEKEFKWYAIIKFENGATTGKHSTQKYATFEPLMAEIKATLNSIP